MSSATPLASAAACIRTFFRSFLQLGQVTSDAADVMLFRPRAVKSAPYASHTWYAACGVFVVGCVLALHADHVPVIAGVVVAAIGIALFRHWARASTGECRRAYLTLAASGYMQLMAGVFHPLEAALAVWFVLAFFFLMNRGDAQSS